MSKEILMKKIDSLPLDKINEVEDFVDFLSQRQVQATTNQTSEKRPEDKLRERLYELGLLRKIKPPITDLTPYENRKPIEVKDKPLSEVIIEERR